MIRKAAQWSCLVQHHDPSTQQNSTHSKFYWCAQITVPEAPSFWLSIEVKQLQKVDWILSYQILYKKSTAHNMKKDYLPLKHCKVHCSFDASGSGNFTLKLSILAKGVLSTEQTAWTNYVSKITTLFKPVKQRNSTERWCLTFKSTLHCTWLPVTV